MKRAYIIFAACMGLAATTSAVEAAPTDDVIRQLQQQGYNEIRMSKTWLGRARIVANARTHSREIIINPSTGEVLRDFVDNGATAIRNVGQNNDRSANRGNSGGNGGGNSGSNGGGNSGGNGGGNSGGNGGGNSGGNGGGNSGGNGKGKGG